MVPPQMLRVGMVGAGYIARWHADAIRATEGLQLTAVCDRAQDAAEGLAAAYGIRPFTDIDDMIGAGVCDAVHILTPPQSHHPLALHCLRKGLHVLVEKPAALSVSELEEMMATADAEGLMLSICHNFLGLPSYQKLRKIVAEGKLGLVSSAQINWSFPLPPLRSGPYGSWLMDQTRNLLLELGPHPYSLAVDLLGPLEIEHVSLGQWIAMPGGGKRPQSWRILARAGNVDVTIALSLVETFDDRSVVLRGSTGMARLDYASDTLVVTSDNSAELVLNPLLKELERAGQHLREGLRNAARQAASLNQKSPYGLSFQNTIAAVYEGLRRAKPDPRFVPAAALNVMQAISDSLAILPPMPAERQARAGTPKPKVMVIGGTGFIGRNLTRCLVERGHDVRVLSRGATGPFDDISDHVEIMGVSLLDEDGLARAMEGMDCVFNLARSNDRNWKDALENDVGTALRISRAARRAGVGRLIYTGTIASYDMSDPSRVITEDTAFGDMSKRNVYARSKAECERRLMDMHDGEGAPLVIARPGIVVGKGGPLQHWGVARWHGSGTARLWGNGQNILPFVLADDVSDALIALMDCPEALGESFNLIGEPMLTGRDYFDAIHQRLGARLNVSSSNLTLLWATDQLKQLLKEQVLRRRDAGGMILADWKSRGHLSRFDNGKARRMLKWAPEANRDNFLRRAIDDARLFW